MRPLAWFLTSGGVLSIAAAAIVGLESPLGVVLASIGIVLVPTVIGVVLWFAPVLRKLGQVRATSDFAFVAQKTPDLPHGLSRLPASSRTDRIRLPTYVIVAVDDDAIRFWSGSAAEPVATVPRSGIAVDMGIVDLARRMPSLRIHFMAADSLPAVLEMVPCRPGWELWAVLDSRETMRFARSIESDDGNKRIDRVDGR
jgi:hypothetical protein